MNMRFDDRNRNFGCDSTVLSRIDAAVELDVAESGNCEATCIATEVL